MEVVTPPDYDRYCPNDVVARAQMAAFGQSPLASLAEDGPVLEFGIGTGCLALPLARGGVTVHGVESSYEPPLFSGLILFGV